MISASLFRGCFWTNFSMNNLNFSNFWFFGNIILTYVKLMILHNQQAVPRLQIHRFVHDYLRNFCIGISCFFMLFRYRFWNWFLIAFLMKNDSKWHPKSIPRVTFSAKMAPKSYDPELRGASWSRPFSSIKILMTFWSHFRPFCSPLDPSWLTLGAFWLDFWSFWLHFACTSSMWPRFGFSLKNPNNRNSLLPHSLTHSLTRSLASPQPNKRGGGNAALPRTR